MPSRVELSCFEVILEVVFEAIKNLTGSGFLDALEVVLNCIESLLCSTWLGGWISLRIRLNSA